MYDVICPHCQKKIRLQFTGLRWRKDEKGEPLYCDSIWYCCPICGADISERERLDMITEMMPALYRSDVTMEEIVKEFQASKGNKERMKHFVTEWLRESWEEELPCP